MVPQSEDLEANGDPVKWSLRTDLMWEERMRRDIEAAYYFKAKEKKNSSNSYCLYKDDI